MEFSGLIAKFPIHRPLSEKERVFNLKQQERLNVEPHYQLSVIKMNSTFLETVDKWYAWKGLVSAVSLSIIAILSSTLGLIAVEWLLEGVGVIPSTVDQGVLIANGGGMAALLIILSWGMVWLLRKESFAYTHYPMRFNRKTRTVHVFRTDGTVLSVPWEKIYFTLINMTQWNEWEVRGHILDSDDVTVRETFALSYAGFLNPEDADPDATEFSSRDFVRAHWEFVRRYMEEGPGGVVDQVQFCMPVDGRRENIRVSIERVFANFSSAPFLIYCIMFPFCLAVSIFRVIAMRTSRVPQWPGDIEEGCLIEQNDPYAIGGAPNGDRVAVFPKAASAAGVRYCKS